MRAPLSLSLLALLSACDSPPFCMSSVCGCEGGEFDTTRSVTVGEAAWAAYVESAVPPTDACVQACIDYGGLETVESCSADTGSADTASGEPLGETGDSGGVQVECVGTAMAYCEGRAPLARPTRLRRAPRTVTEWAGHGARAERNSIVAFRELSDLLRRLGAPEELVKRAHDAAIEEAGHTLAMLSLAPNASLGRAPRPLPGAGREGCAERDLAQLAVHNAVEGCVGECWAALLALHQARHAADPAVRETMAAIAPEEVGHAELAWAIDAWLTPQLSAPERRRVQRARSRAVQRLVRNNRLAHPAVLDRLGLPDAAGAHRLATAFATWF